MEKNMRVMTHYACENLKQCGPYEIVADIAHYHRFLGYFFDENEVVSEENLPITYEDYVQLKKNYPGWSQGYLSPRHSAWKDEYGLQKELPMNLLLDKYRK